MAPSSPYLDFLGSELESESGSGGCWAVPRKSAKNGALKVEQHSRLRVLAETKYKKLNTISGSHSEC